jgi:hypothetical protein
VPIVLVAADLIPSQGCRTCRFAIGINLSCAMLINDIVTYNLGDPDHVLGGWATAEFEVSITCDLLNFSLVDDSKCSFLMTLI